MHHSNKCRVLLVDSGRTYSTTQPEIAVEAELETVAETNASGIVGGDGEALGATRRVAVVLTELVRVDADGLDVAIELGFWVNDATPTLGVCTGVGVCEQLEPGDITCIGVCA